ncbi:MAG: LL-diaminopimelate aminotransferase [Phycisphaerales bacterium]|nr:LL-diaminopimelate aminotransferase [Phycisphaerales bacterium]
MVLVNEHYLKLAAGYLFPEIDRRVREHLEAHPEARTKLINCGVGDVTEPLPASAREAMKQAVDELGEATTFRGYGPPLGHDFLREAIVEHDFRARGMDISPDEIFVSDGSKGDAGSLLEILDPTNRIAVADPVYPVYVDTNVMAGATGHPVEDGGYEGVVYMPMTRENGFVPALPEAPVDVVYLCSPNNPTGAVLTREDLGRWVDWARTHDALIVFDAAYEAFIRDDAIPHSIYEIEGARDCAIECRSFSKNGGFTGVRCGYTVCPRSLEGATASGRRVRIHELWTRRWQTRSNGVSWPVQRGAAALYTDDGRREVRALTDYYMENVRILRETCEGSGLTVFGGRNAPYAWVECPEGLSSWQVFDLMLQRGNIVVTPGCGFGRCGEGYFRISAFSPRASVSSFADRLAGLEWLACT